MQGESASGFVPRYKTGGMVKLKTNFVLT